MPAVAVQPLPESRPEAPDEADLIRRFEREAQVPSWLEARYRQMADDAKYLNETAFANENEHQRGINILERMIDAKLAQIYPADPMIEVKPEHILGAELLPPDFVTQQGLMRRAVAQTNEALARKLWAEAHGPLVFQGAAHDALGVGISYVKITWQEDASRDPLGRRKNGDAQDQMARLRRLASEYAAGEWDEGDGRYMELMHLSEYAIVAARQAFGMGDPRASRLAAMASASPGDVLKPWMIPEPLQWVGAAINPVRADNLRLDWATVTAPELFYHGRHMTELSWMHWEEVAETYGLSLEEARKLGHRRDTGEAADERTGVKAETEAEDPEGSDLEDTRRGDMVRVYERWDRTAHRYYCWAAGLDRFLHTEIPQVTNRHFFPYVQVLFSRPVMRYHPTSDVYRGKKMQDQINQKLTDDDEARIARYDKYLVDDSVDDEDLARIESADPHAAIRVHGAEEVAKKFHQIKGAPYDPRLFDVGEDIHLLELQLGAPMQATGAVNQAKFATEAKIANDHMLAQSGKGGDMLRQAIQTAAVMILDYANAAMPAENVKRLVGEGAVWPVYDREELWRSMRVEVQAGGSSAAAKRQNVESWSVAAKAIAELLQAKLMAAQAGYDLNIEPMVASVMAELDIRMPVQEVLRLMAPQMPAGPMIAGPGSPAPQGGPGPMAPMPG